MNRYLQDRAYKRNMRDGRNPYGSRGGYVSSRKGRGRDRESMDRNYDYRDYDMRNRNMDYHHQPMSNYHLQQMPYGMPMFREYEMNDYARGNRGGNRGNNRDYGMDYNYDYARYDYGRYDYESEDMEKEWKEHLKKWCEELKRYDRFNMPKDQILQSARQMGVSFDNYNEEEFLTTYYMVMSDYPQIANEPHTYIALAKDWLEDKDSKLKGGEED